MAMPTITTLPTFNNAVRSSAIMSIPPSIDGGIMSFTEKVDLDTGQLGRINRLEAVFATVGKIIAAIQTSSSQVALNRLDTFFDPLA